MRRLCLNGSYQTENEVTIKGARKKNLAFLAGHSAQAFPTWENYKNNTAIQGWIREAAKKIFLIVDNLLSGGKGLYTKEKKEHF